MAIPHTWHDGELYIQSQLGHKDAVAGAHSIFRPQLTVQHQQFHTSLNILPVCTLDAHGRPWGSFLAAKDGQNSFIQSPSLTTLVAAHMKLHDGHPVEAALKNGAKFGMTQLVKDDDRSYQGPALKLIAGVGVMFENRRRNKFAGFINERNVGTDDDRTIQVEVMESLGNCPKYINTRHLVPNPSHNPVVLYKTLDLPPGELLPAETLAHIGQADTIFLATRYTSPVQTIFKSHLGINIRGGKPGFLRMATETIDNEQRQVAYLPDYSGNRFMSSLGNIHSDKVAGITIPLMQNDTPIDVVYLTGDAEVLLGAESTRIFPGVTTCARIVLTGFMHVQDAVPLMPTFFDPAEGVEDFTSNNAAEGIGWSPYNPPVRRLRAELSSLSPTEDTSLSTASLNEAKIANFELHTPELATITVTLSQPVVYRAGQHVILDCASLLPAEVREYKHMSDKYGGERELNDSGVRTWTISSAPMSIGAAENELKVTMRRVENGLVTPRLFEMAAKGTDVKVPVLGIGGDFTLPEQPSRKLLWVASGVGITPFLSFLRSLSYGRPNSRPDITMIVAVRRTEVAAMLKLVNSCLASDSAPPSPKGRFDIHVVSSGLEDSDSEEAVLRSSVFDTKITRHNTRLTPELLLTISGASQRDGDKAEAWVCGPPSLESWVVDTLETAHVSEVHRESFNF